MTPFLQWWADHWALIPVLMTLYLLYPWWQLIVFEWELKRSAKRRREP